MIIRKTMLICIIAIFTVFAVPPAGLAVNSPKVILDGKTLTFDAPPIIENGRTYVPMRTIFEALGAQINWSDATKTITATKASSKIVLNIGKQTALINGKSINLESPAKIVSGRTLVPLRFVSEALGSEVNWNAATLTITITSSKSSSNSSEQDASGVQTVATSKVMTPDDAIKLFKDRLESIGKTLGVDENGFNTTLEYDEDIVVDGVVYYVIYYNVIGEWSGGSSVYAVNSINGDIYSVSLGKPRQLEYNISDIEAFKKEFLG